MKRKANLIVLVLLITLLVGCSGSEEEKSTEIRVPLSAKELKKENYEDAEIRLQAAGFENIEFKEKADLITGWLTKEGDVERVSIEGITDFEANDVFEKDAKVVITYHVFPEESNGEGTSSEIESTSEISETTSESSKNEVAKKKSDNKSDETEEIITIQNNEEFAHIINKSDDEESYKKFAEKYQGKKIEFDGNIAYMDLHQNKNTRYDFLIFGGDYRTDGSTGVPFQIRDESVTSGLNLIGDNIPDSISEGLNIRLIAEVVEYNSRGGLLLIKPVETRVR